VSSGLDLDRPPGQEDGRDRRVEAERGGIDGSIGLFRYRCLGAVGCVAS
jgi:hypothetical protein